MNMIRPDNVPSGAYVQWEIELLDFEMAKVITIICLFILVHFVSSCCMR